MKVALVEDCSKLSLFSLLLLIDQLASSLVIGHTHLHFSQGRELDFNLNGYISNVAMTPMQVSAIMIPGWTP